MLMKKTSRKLRMVSYSVIPIWVRRAFFSRRVMKLTTTRLGLEKKKESMILRSAHTSHKMRKAIKMKTRAKDTIR